MESITNRLADPRSLAIVDNIYLRQRQPRILKYAPDTGLLTAVAGRSGLTGTNNGPGFLARFSHRRPGFDFGRIAVAIREPQPRFVDIFGDPLVTNLPEGLSAV